MPAAISPVLATALSRLLGTAALEDVADLMASMETVHLSRGEVLYRQGDSALGMHVVLTGRLQVRVAADGGAPARVVADLGPGEVVGEVALFTGGQRSATVVALRDTTLGCLSGRTFNAFATRHPAAATSVARFIVARLLESQRGGVPTAPGVRTIAFVPLDPGLDGGEFCRRLQLALLRHGRTALVDAPAVHVRFAALSGGEGSKPATELEAFLDAREKGNEFVVLEADPGPTSWTRKCVSYADLVLLAVRAGTSPATAAARAATILGESGELAQPRLLVLVHPEESVMPAGTAAWREAVPCERHLHLCWAGQEGFRRLGRVLSGNAVALVLGGGGARGFAHVGVVRALREAGVPIDAVGGASFGAIVGGAVAMGWDDERMLEEFKSAFVDERPMDDYTLPVMSLIRGEKMARGLRSHLGDALIEDLWIPFFAVSSNLSRNREHVHWAGPLWRALRASASLPAIFPPLVEDGELLVDGGLLNNLPVDVMRRLVRGHIIAVDLSAGTDLRFDREELPSAWEFLRAHLLRSAGRPPVPTIDRVVLKATMLASRREVEAARRDADLFLNPPTQGFDLLDWGRFLEIFEVGYRDARSRLSEWLAARPAAASLSV